MLYSVYVLFFIVAYATGSSIKFEKCPQSDAKQKACLIHEVQIDPCKKNEQTGNCKVKPNTNVTLRFDYTPGFEADSVKSLVYRAGMFSDVPFSQQPDNACLFTTCPMKAGVRQRYTRTLHVPDNSYSPPFGVTIKGKMEMWKSDEIKNQCCFRIPLDI